MVAGTNTGNSNYAVVNVRQVYLLVQIQLHFALITFHSAAKNLIAAFGTHVAGLFVSNPFFITELSSIWDGPKNNLLANCHGEIVNIVTGKVIALMTPRVAFLSCASPDLTLSAMHELFIRQAATAFNIFYRKVFTIRKCALAGCSSLVKTYQPLLKLNVIVAVCDINGTDTAIKTTRRNQIGICRHCFRPQGASIP